MKWTVGVAVFAGLPFAALLPAQDIAGVRDAIRFEKNKDAADARQAQIAGQGPTSGSAARQEPERVTTGSVAAETGHPVLERGPQDAIAMERAKDAADARQARIEAQRSGAFSSADRAASRR